MAAQTQDARRPWREGALVGGVPLQASTTVYAGAVVEIDANGRIAPGTKAASKTYFGVALGGGVAVAAGAASIEVRRRATVRLKISGTAVRGKPAYLVDDQTVTDVSTGASRVGRIVDLEDGDAWVDMADMA